ncbi:carbohydrate-binding protein, partial [Nonomuraea fuscirosea]
MRLRSRLTALATGLALALTGAGLASGAPAAYGDTAQVQQLAAAWAPWTSYATGAVVTYNGVDYVCLQAHTSQPGWEPPNVPALWKQGSGGGGGGDTSAPSV